MDELLKRDDPISDSTARRIKHASDKVLKYMFFADEAAIPKIEIADSAFAQAFHAREPKDSKERSLYQLRANRRMFRYPFSYLVYTDTFNDLPQEALDYIWPEIERILDPTIRYEGLQPLVSCATRPLLKRSYWKPIPRLQNTGSDGSQERRRFKQPFREGPFRSIYVN